MRPGGLLCYDTAILFGGGIILELRRAFDADAANYDRFRPGYPPELFAEIVRYSGLGAGSRALEIGLGTGQATVPILRTGCRVTAVELGENLCRFAREKFGDERRLTIVNGDFNTVPLEKGAYDLIYCATAFHWLAPEEAYPKVLSVLKPGGTLALFWNHPFPNREGDPSNEINRAVYAKYRPSDEKVREFTEGDCEKRRSELKTFGFRAIVSKVYRRTRTLSSDDYIGLLNTYSDHCVMEPAAKAAFEREMKADLDRNGGFIRIYDTIDLYLAHRP